MYVDPLPRALERRPTSDCTVILRSATTEIRVNIGARAGSELEPTAIWHTMSVERMRLKMRPAGTGNVAIPRTQLVPLGVCGFSIDLPSQRTQTAASEYRGLKQRR